MRVLLTSEARFERTGDGTVWGPAAYGSALWNRYLDVFSDVVVAARVTDVERPSDGCVVASTSQIAFCRLSPYSGLGGLLRNTRTVCRALAVAVRSCPAIIVRSPSPIAQIAASITMALNRPYGAEIVGDPDQVFSAGAFHHPLRVAVRRAATAAQASLARHATAVLFVTRDVLQRKYPTPGQAFSASDAALDDAAFGVEPPDERRATEPFTVVTVGALDQPYKGIAVLLDAMRELLQTGVDVRLNIVGTGGLLGALQQRARVLGVDPHVAFLGQLDRDGVRRALDAAHVFVLPSLTEGLPRALLEAMARGLPAVATNVGGIPELLPRECLVQPADVQALAEKIRHLAADDRARKALGDRNRHVARTYHERVQAPVRHGFLLAVRAASFAGRREAVCA
jgi:glycosyltransferase involved in cell wall biosynthesis